MASTHVCSSLAQKIGKSAKIVVRKVDTTLELRDLDEFCRKEDACEAQNVELDDDIDVLTVIAAARLGTCTEYVPKTQMAFST